MMKNWYLNIKRDFSKLPDFIEYYEKEYLLAKEEVSASDGLIEEHCSKIPGIIEHRFAQLQDIEAVLEYSNLQMQLVFTKVFKKYLENYNTKLSSQTCKIYTEGDKEVVQMKVLVNEVALIRNKYLSILKGLDAKNFMLGHITKLRVAGVEDAVLNHS